MLSRTPTRTLIQLLTALALSLAACGGGGGSESEDDMLDAVDQSEVDGNEDTVEDIPPECTTDDDCDIGDQSRCSPEGRCVHCVENNDCPFETPVCSPGYMCSPCGVSADCEGSVFGEACDLTEGLCVECIDQSDCSGDRPICNTLQGLCVGCEVSFDCTDPAAPACAVSEDGRTDCQDLNLCEDDDAYEASGNDGPAGAVEINPADGMTTATISDAVICSAPPGEERDWFFFDVADGDNATISLSWTEETADLDISVYDDNGLLYGDSWYQNPESVTLTYLPAGRVYFEVTRFDSRDDTTTIPYEVGVEITSSGGCSQVADCAAEYANQIFRGNCAPSGACIRIEGEAALSNGSLCDSPGDCESGNCTYGRLAFQDLPVGTILYWAVYTANADTLSICTELCDPTMRCPDLNTKYCTVTFGDANYCALKCSSNEECPIDQLSFPEGDDTWFYTPCNNNQCESVL